MTDSLAVRREALLARCAQQRVQLALDVQALRAPARTGRPFARDVAGMLGARLLADKRLVLGAAGAALALAVIRPARLLRAATLLTAGWRMAQNGMGLVARFRQ